MNALGGTRAPHLRRFDPSDSLLPAYILPVLRDLREELTSLDGVEAVAVFGSYSKGTYHKDSDIDIAVFVSDTADQTALFRRAMAAAARFDWDIQILLFPLETLSEPAGIVAEVTEFGWDLDGL